MELPKQFDNITTRVIDDLKATLKKGSKVSLAAAYFSIFAFEALQKELARYRIDACPKTGAVGLLGAAESGEETLADAVVAVLSEALVDWKEAEHGIRGLYEAWKLRKA